MASDTGKVFSPVPLFDPAEGIAVRFPLNHEPGWWAGAPTATYDVTSNTFYLVYRLRQPRDQGRGIECRIAASDNGPLIIIDLATRSICSCCCIKANRLTIFVTAR